MAVNSFLSNQGTMTALLTDNTGGTAGTLIPLMKLDISSQGTAGTIWGGNVGITGGTINTLGTLPNLPGGSISVTTGTFSGGTLNLGTFVGNVSSGVTDSGNPVKIAGVFQGTAGTITDGQRVNLQTDNVGNLKVYLATKLDATNDSVTIGGGTLSTGTITIGTFVGKDANAAAQTGNPISIGGTDSGGTVRTIKVDAGGLQRIGLDSGTVSVLPNLPQGSINVTAGTFVGNGGSMGANGMGANAVAAVGNPVRIGGTDSGGTTYGFLTDTAGHMKTDMITGTVNVGTFVMPSGTMTTGSLSNVAMLNAGTVVTSSGTITNSGTTTGVGSVSSLGSLGMLTAGTVSMINAGTLGTITNLGQLYNAGTVQNQLAGTLTALQNGTITAGTINAGTFRADSRTTQNIVTFGTQVAFSGAAAATIVGSAAVGAGTSLWLQDVSLFNTQSAAGTFILGFGTTQQGTNVLLRAPLGTSSAPGVEKPFAKAVNAGMTNQDLVLSATGAGTVDLTLSYFISA